MSVLFVLACSNPDYPDCEAQATPSATMDGYRDRMRRMGWTSRKVPRSRHRIDGCPKHPVAAKWTPR